MPGSLFVAALLNPQEIALSAGGRFEINAAKGACHQKFILACFRNQGAADGFGIPFRTAIAGYTVTDDGMPVAKIQRLHGFTLFLGDRLEFALEIEPGDLAHDRPQNLVIQGDWGE